MTRPRYLFIVALLLIQLGAALLVPTASWAALILYQGFDDLNDQAALDVTYVGSSTNGTLSLVLDNTSPQFAPIITGLAFDRPAGIGDLAPIQIPINWGFANAPGSVTTPGSVGVFDSCAETGFTNAQCNGGIPAVGLGPQDGTFAFTFSATGSGLSESAFVAAMNNFGESAVVLQNTGPNGQGSDVATSVSPQVAFLTAFNTAQNSLTQFTSGETLVPSELDSDRILAQDVISKREQIELEFQREVDLINANFLLDLGEATLTAGVCVATGGAGCVVAATEFLAGEVLESATARLLCERGDTACELAVNSAFFTINPTFEAYSFDFSAIVRSDNLALLGALNVGDEVGINVPLFGSAHTLNLVRIGGIEADRVDFHIDGVRQLNSTAVPVPPTLILVAAGVLIAAAKYRRH